MLFTDVFSNMPSELTQLQKVAYLQTAYEFVVKKLRLDPTVLPIMITGQRVKISGFEYKLNTVTVNSEVAIKEIKSFAGLEFTNPLDEDRYTLGAGLVGNVGDTDHGFEAVAFAAVNDTHTTSPEIYWSGTDLTCANLTSSLIVIQSFVYPYFCMHTVDDQYTVEHRYDIQWMIDGYGTTYLEIDDTLGTLTLIKALSLYYGEMQDINYENIYDKCVIDTINIYNRFNSLKYSDSYETIGTLEAYLE